MTRSLAQAASALSNALTLGYIWRRVERRVDRDSPGDAWCGPPPPVKPRNPREKPPRDR